MSLENYDTVTADIYHRSGVEADSVMLNDILFWHSRYYSKYSHFEVSNKSNGTHWAVTGVFIDYSGENTELYVWDLTKRYLHQQSDKLMQFLADLVNQSSHLRG